MLASWTLAMVRARRARIGARRRRRPGRRCAACGACAAAVAGELPVPNPGVVDRAAPLLPDPAGAAAASHLLASTDATLVADLVGLLTQVNLDHLYVHHRHRRRGRQTATLMPRRGALRRHFSATVLADQRELASSGICPPLLLQVLSVCPGALAAPAVPSRPTTVSPMETPKTSRVRSRGVPIAAPMPTPPSAERPARHRDTRPPTESRLPSCDAARTPPITPADADGSAPTPGRSRRARKRAADAGPDSGAAAVASLEARLEKLLEYADATNIRCLPGARATDGDAEDGASDGDGANECELVDLLSAAHLDALLTDLSRVRSAGRLSTLNADSLIRLLGVLDRVIQSAMFARVPMPGGRASAKGDAAAVGTVQRVMRALKAAACTLTIVTAPEMPRRVCVEEVIEHACQLIKFHLFTAAFAALDPSYAAPTGAQTTNDAADAVAVRGRGDDGEVEDTPKRRHLSGSVRTIAEWLCLLMARLAELLAMHPLSDTIVVECTAIGIAPFFVERADELQLHALGIARAIFAHYERHRPLILDEIYASLVKLPTGKRGLHNYRYVARAAARTASAHGSRHCTACPTAGAPSKWCRR